MNISVHEGASTSLNLTPKNPDAMDVDDDEDQEEEKDEDINSALERLRRSGGEDATVNGNKEVARTQDADDDFKHEWHTYKYRPILGMCLMGNGHEDAAGKGGLEVAVVERPIWEADLPPRYYGDQEWEKKDF